MNGKPIKRGDTVYLLDDNADMVRLQRGHGFWKDDYRPLLGKPVVIQFFDNDGDVVVHLGRMGRIVSINPKALKLADTVRCREYTEASIGSTVKVSVTAAEFQRLQTEQFGGWSSALGPLIGASVTVEKISCKYQVASMSPDCTIRVRHRDQAFWLNPMAVTVTLKQEGGSTSGSNAPNKTESDAVHNGKKTMLILLDIIEPWGWVLNGYFMRFSMGPKSTNSCFSALTIIPFEQLKLERRIGSGAFGKVYLAKWSVTQCAVKEVQSEDIIEGAEKDRIIQEARTHRSVERSTRLHWPTWSTNLNESFVLIQCVIVVWSILISSSFWGLLFNRPPCILSSNTFKASIWTK